MSENVSLSELSREEIVSQMVEVILNKEDDFLVVRETLTRMGLANSKEKKLYQSCHIFHKKGKFYIVHFKEMLAMDGLDVVLSKEDIARRNTIANQLVAWGLVELVDKEKTKAPVLLDRTQLFILPHNQKKEWILITKYQMGKKVLKG